FKTFTIKYQSQQYIETEDGVTTNYLTFVADTTNNCVYVIVGTEEPEEQDLTDATARIAFTGYSKITIEFTSYTKGDYALKITDNDGICSDDDTTGYTYALTNIGSSYSKYVSSSSGNSVIPMTFSASFADGSTDSAEMVLYELNTQSFILSGDEGARTVTDNRYPVLCVDDDFTSVRYGYGLELNYAVIDVLATSPRTTIYYYILTQAQVDADVSLEEASDTVEFTSVSTSDTYAFIDCEDYYKSFTDTTEYGYTTKCLVKIYLTITDSTASGGKSDNVYLEWYVEDKNNLETVKDGDAYESQFIRVVKDIEGATYNYTPADVTYTDASQQEVTVTYSGTTFAYANKQEIQDEYNALLESAVKDQEATAGDDNYLYLPSFEGYLFDNLTGYQDLTYSIYYVAGSDTSVSSSTGLDYNELSISLSSEGQYRFVIFATDGESNEMYYLTYDEDNGSWTKKVTFSADDVAEMLADADHELWAYVPYFEFSVTYEGLSVTTPEAQDIAFVDSTYTAESFDITGLNSGYTESYTLYVFDREAYTEDHETISYSYMIAHVAEIFENAESRSKYFTQIIALADLEETDEYYDDYCDYEWDADALSFVPQDENTFYIIRLVVTDTVYKTDATVEYMVINSSAAAEELSGESTWVSDNLASIILLAVAGAALIGIILLIVIKPKEKGDIDVIDFNEEDKKSRKKIAKDKKSEDNE
ncbi:MAG: hypothetical protein LUI60_02665, partial [Clostridia bacterium]|nr:hypothetical protein [Clostridia bacterium]